MSRLVHDNTLSCFYTNTHKHASRPPRLQLVSKCTFGSRHTRSNSRGSPVENLEKVGTMLEQPSQQRTSGLQRNPRFLLQEVFEGPRQSVHRLKARLASELLLLSPLRESSGTISPCQPFLTASQRTTILIGLEDNLLVPNEIQISHQTLQNTGVPHLLTALGDSRCLYSCDLARRALEVFHALNPRAVQRTRSPRRQ